MLAGWSQDGTAARLEGIHEEDGIDDRQDELEAVGSTYSAATLADGHHDHEGAEGDEGGRALIRAGFHVVTSPDELIDIDTPEDLAALRARFRPRAG